MKTQIVLLLTLSLIFSTAGYAANAQTLQFADHVVINEVDTNPRGDDYKTTSEWIEIYNPTSESVDIGGWEIASTTILKKTLTIPAGTVIQSEQFLTYSYQPIWFADRFESVELRDADGNVVDKTPLLTDLDNNASSWQRVYDALDSDSNFDWSFGPSSAGSTNGHPETPTNRYAPSIKIDSEKSSYLFGQTAVLTGSVSKQVFTEKPIFAPADIRITVIGPDYSHAVIMYPDLNLEFSTSLDLNRVLGINEGAYNVTAEYAGSSDTTQFFVGDEIIETAEKEDGTLSIFTDSDSYIPGQTVTITASTTEEIPFEGLKFTVEDPQENIISEGTLFPSSDVNIHGVFNAKEKAQFVTSLFLDTVSPVHGKYRIAGQYSTQTAETSFDVSPDVKDASVVSVSTDKPVYEPGDTVVISGRSNQYYIPTLELEVVKASSLNLNSTAATGIKILDDVRLAGDSSFVYEIPVPDNFTSFGIYRVSVSGQIGTFVTTFSVVDDSSNFVESDESFVVLTDKDIYKIGDSMHISGLIQDQARNNFETPTVHITIEDDNGKSLSIAGLSEKTKAHVNDGTNTEITFNAIPDLAGRFVADTTVFRTLFEEGAYKITAKYNGLVARASVVVVDPLDVGSTDIVAFLDKDLYGLDETLNLSGTFGSQVTDSQGVVITVYAPTGDTNKYGTNIDGGFFSWSWQTPIEELTRKSSNERIPYKSNLGIYRIHLETGGNHADLFFKVSANPKNDSFDFEPVTITTDKTIYHPGDRLEVSGFVMEKPSGSDGPLIPDLVKVQLLSNKIPFKPIFEANVYPQQGGHYFSNFELAPTLFLEGTYKIRSTYNDHRVETTFSVTSDFGDNGSAELILDLTKNSYYPGETMVITGKPDKIVYFEGFDIEIIKESQSRAKCGSSYCGDYASPPASMKPDASAEFRYTYSIPANDSIGSYEIIVDAGFDTKSVTFDVVEESVQKPGRIIDKVNRISETEITITPQSMTSEGHDFVPRVISGSLLTPDRGDESNVNLRIVSPDGVCIIGQADECAVSDSTRTQGSIYETVEFGGSEYNVRYSGPGATFEKFSILPVQDDGQLPTEPFDVYVIKDDQPSRLYYKITYVPVE